MLVHELGHWKFSHTLANLVIASAHFFFFFFYPLALRRCHAFTYSAMILSNFGYGGMIREVLRGGRIGRKREAEIGVPIRR